MSDKVKWALETVDVHPTMWSHKYSGTPISILKEEVKKKQRKPIFPLLHSLLHKENIAR